MRLGKPELIDLTTGAFSHEEGFDEGIVDFGEVCEVNDLERGPRLWLGVLRILCIDGMSLMPQRRTIIREVVKFFSAIKTESASR